MSSRSDGFSALVTRDSPPLAADSTTPLKIAGTATAPVVSMTKADATHDGYLKQDDWSTFNNKQNKLTPVPPLAIDGSGNLSFATGDYIANNGSATPQPNASFNIDGNGSLGGTVSTSVARVANDLYVRDIKGTQSNSLNLDLLPGSASGLIRFNNYQYNGVIGSIDNSGNLSVAGNVSAGGNLSVSGSVFNGGATAGYVDGGTWVCDITGPVSAWTPCWTKSITVPRNSIAMLSLSGCWNPGGPWCYATILVDGQPMTGGNCSTSNSSCVGSPHTYLATWSDLALTSFTTLTAGTHTLAPALVMASGQTCSVQCQTRISYALIPQ